MKTKMEKLCQCNHSRTRNTCKPARIDWKGFISMTAGKTPTTLGTPTTPDSLKSSGVYPAPEAKTYQLEDGGVRVEVGEFWKVVSSWHLVDPAENQLIKAWRDHYR